MKTFLLALIGATALGCEISPVVNTPADSPGGRYGDCDQAARDYCEYVVEAKSKDMDACVAKYRFECVSSRARLGTRRPGAG